MAAERIGGVIRLRLDGNLRRAKGSFKYNLGRRKREMVVGTDSVHGYKEMIQVPYIEGIITDKYDVRSDDILNFTGEATLQLNNGKTIVLSNSVYTNEGEFDTEEGELGVRFEGTSAQEILGRQN